MKKLLLLILKLSLVLFLSFLMHVSLSLSPYSEGYQLTVYILIGVVAVVGLIVSAGIAIRKVYIQELEIRDKRIKIAIILSIFWAAWWIASIGFDYLVIMRRYIEYGLLWRFLIAFLPLLYFCILQVRRLHSILGIL